MSQDLSGSIDLLKLHNSGMATIRGVRCLVIPIDGNDLYVTKDDTTGRAKSCYLGLQIRQRREVSQFGKTHYCKQQLSKEFREGANPEIVELKKKTYLGDFKPMIFDDSNQAGTVQVAPLADTDVQEDDLPF